MTSYRMSVGEPTFETDPVDLEVGMGARPRPSQEPVAVGEPTYEMDPIELDVRQRPPMVASRQPSRRPPPKQPDRSWLDDEAQVNEVATNLLSKGIQGAALPGEGIVPFGALPEEFRQAIPQDIGPIVGFDPQRLDDRERELLVRLALASQQQAQQRRAEEEAARLAQGPVRM